MSHNKFHPATSPFNVQRSPYAPKSPVVKNVVRPTWGNPNNLNPIRNAGPTGGMKPPKNPAPKPAPNPYNPPAPNPPAIKPNQVMPSVGTAPRTNVGPRMAPQPRRAAPSVSMPPMPPEKPKGWMSVIRETFEDPYDQANAKVQLQNFPGYRNTNADNTAWNAMKHAGTAAEVASKYGWQYPTVGGMAHEWLGLAAKYLGRDPRQWLQNPKGQDFGLREDLRRNVMDTRNNLIGTAIGTARNRGFVSAEGQQALLEYALKNGWLQVLRGPQYPQPNGYLFQQRKYR